jgi:hypothetical protein
VLLDAAFTPSFDQWGGLLLGVAWLAGLCIAAAIVFRRVAVPHRA